MASLWGSKDSEIFRKRMENNSKMREMIFLIDVKTQAKGKLKEKCFSWKKKNRRKTKDSIENQEKCVQTAFDS